MNKTYAIQGNVIGRSDKNGPQGCGWNEDLSFTLNATDRHVVVYAYDNHPIDSRVTPMPETCTTVCTRWETGGLNTPIILHVIGDEDV